MVRSRTSRPSNGRLMMSVRKGIGYYLLAGVFICLLMLIVEPMPPEATFGIALIMCGLVVLFWPLVIFGAILFLLM